MGFLTDFIKNTFSSEEKIKKLLNESTDHPIKKDLTFPAQKNTQARKPAVNPTPVKRLDSEYSIPLNEMINIQLAILVESEFLRKQRGKELKRLIYQRMIQYKEYYRKNAALKNTYEVVFKVFHSLQNKY